MNLTGIIQTIIGGVGSGTIYALLGLSFTLVFGRLKICSVLHGDLALLAAYISYTLFTKAGMDPFVSLIITVPVFFFIGYLVQNIFMKPFMKLDTWKGRYQGQVMTTWGIGMCIMAIEYFIFSGTYKTLNVTYRNKSVALGDVYIPVVSIVILAVTIAVVIFIEMLLKRTSLGIQIRACSSDRTTALLSGINYEKVCAVTFGISGSLAALAGTFYALRNQLGPAEGFNMTFLGWVAVIIGGMGSLKGALLAGLLMGVIESVEAYLGVPALQKAVLYIVLIVFLIFRPNGIFRKAAEA